MLVSNTSGVITVRQGSPTGGTSTHSSTLDMSGLTNFTAYVSRFLVAGDAVQSGNNALLREAGVVYPGANKPHCLRGCSGTPGVGIADGPGFASGGIVYLGVTNAIFADGGMFVGYRKSTGVLSFNSAILWRQRFFATARAPAVRTYGGSANNATGGRDGRLTMARQLYPGTVDALVDMVYVGRSQTAATRRPSPLPATAR